MSIGDSLSEKPKRTAEFRGRQFAIDCEYCAPYPSNHLLNWVGDFYDLFINYPLFSVVPQSLMPFFYDIASFITDKVYINLFILLGFVHGEKNFPLEKMNPMSALFIERGRLRGIEFEVFLGPFGYLDDFRMRINGRERAVDCIPIADYNSPVVDDKWKMKKILKKLGYPVAKGRFFWWFQKGAAIKFAEKLQYPVVVKPRKGSLSQHMFIVHDRKSLSLSIPAVIKYTPVFIVEKYIPDAILYRATVINKKQMFVVRRLPAAVVGDGENTLETLIRKMDFSLEDLDLGLLRTYEVNLQSVIPSGKMIQLTDKRILALKSRLEPVLLSEIHPRFIAMWLDIASRLDLPLVGIDTLLSDHRLSPDDQTAALLELNSLPNILLHKNEVADALVDAVLTK
jgi:cyanophycin synthetase